MQKFHCQLIQEGTLMTGVLEISDTDIDLTLVDYEGGQAGLGVNADDTAFETPLILRTESDQIVTFYGFKTNSRLHGNVRTHTFVGNNLTIGRTALTKNDLIRRARFEVPYCERIITQHSRTKRHTQDESFDGVDDPIFSIELDDCILRAKYRKSVTLAHKDTNLAPNLELSVYIEIDFKIDVNLDTYSEYVWNFVRLLSFSAGEPLQPDNITVFTISASKIGEIVDTAPFELDNYRYRVLYTHTSLEVPDRLSIPNAIITAKDETELVSFENCMRKWFDCSKDWRAAYGLMSASLGYGNSFDPDRIVTAVRWLEKIPTAKHRTGISDADLTFIVNAAQAAAKECGHTDLDRQLASKIKAVGSETHKQMLERLHDAIKGEFGQDILPDFIIGDLRAAITCRSKVAHGDAPFKDVPSQKKFAQLVYAMEAFCVLLTAAALPLSDRGKANLIGHKAVRRYRNWCQSKAADGL